MNYKEYWLKPLWMSMIVIFVVWIVILLLPLKPTITLWFSISLGIVFVIPGSLLIQSLFTIPSDPQHFGMITEFDKMDWIKPGEIVFVGPGLHSLLLRGLFRKVVLVDISQRQPEFTPQDVLTPDNVNEEIPISVGYIPDKYNYITFINLKKDPGVLISMKEIIESEVRKWSRHPTEGPQSWEEIIKSSLKAINFLIKSLGQYLSENSDDIVPGYDYLKTIESSIPTEILIDWYDGNNPSNSIVRKEYGDGEEDFEKPFIQATRWQKLEQMIPGSLQNNCTEANLKQQIKERKQLLIKLRDGKAMLPTISLGIVLCRLSITQIKPFGPIYEASVALQKEQKERISEVYEITTELEKAKILRDELAKSGVTVTIQEALQKMMSWKIEREANKLVSVSALAKIITDSTKGGPK
ncbi:MAG: hypothetical protein WC603_03625 [Candidatus Paceibacterota bacterium]|jgi:hypothetical protein